MKRAIIQALCAVWAAALVTGCAKAAVDSRPATPATPASGKLIVWSFTDEVRSIIDDYYLPAHPAVECACVSLPADRLAKALNAAWGANASASAGMLPAPATITAAGGEAADRPDVVTLGASDLRRWVESGLLLDLTDLASPLLATQLAYPLDAATWQGRTYAIAWQASPGAFFYRRSLAKRYLGTDNPESVGAMVETFSGFEATAARLKERSGGRCYMVASAAEAYAAYQGARKRPWLNGKKPVVDSSMVMYMDMFRRFREKGYEAGVAVWSSPWFDALRGELSDDRGPAEVFGFFLTDMGLEYALKTNAPATAGDWAMVRGPGAFYQGGVWLAVAADAANPQAAREFVGYVASSDFQRPWAERTGALVTNIAAQAELFSRVGDPFLGGQNPDRVFSSVARAVNASLAQSTDAAIDACFAQIVATYAAGEFDGVDGKASGNTAGKAASTADTAAAVKAAERRFARSRAAAIQRFKEQAAGLATGRGALR